MKAAIHYLVTVKVVLLNESNEIDFEEYQRIFEDVNPIVARAAAFNYYQTNIDNFLLSKDKTYISDQQARKELNSFIDPGTKTRFGDPELNFSNSFGNGIGVYMVIDQPKRSEDANSF